MRFRRRPAEDPKELRDPWGGSAKVERIDPHEVRAAWEAARAASSSYPVAVTAWNGELDGRQVWRQEPDRPPQQVLVDAASASSDPLSPEEEHSGGGEAGSDGSHMTWFVPDDPTYLLLIENAGNSEEAMAHLGFWGLDDEGLTPARLVALVRGWRERFGAELVANWGTMLQFVVARPPEDLETAYALALEHWEVASDTMLLPGVPIREHARDLIGRGDWFLHNRP